MKELEPIIKGGKRYPLIQIEQSDAADLEGVCAGFIHGGKLEYLEFILNKGKLKCSDSIRKKGKIKLARDAVSKGPDGQGVYFRFVPAGVSMSKILQTFTGPGAAGGFFIFMPSRNVADLSFFTMSSGDYKYSIPLTLDNMKRIAGEVKDRIREGTNNSEIAFYKKVCLSRAAEIYIAEKNARKGSEIDKLLIDNGYRPDREADKMIRRRVGYPVNGYVNYLRYRRISAAAAVSSDSASPGSCEASSRKTEGSHAAQPDLPSS